MHLMSWQFQKHHVRKKKQEPKPPAYWEEITRLCQHHIFPGSASRENKNKFITQPSCLLALFLSSKPALPLTRMCTFTLINFALSCLLFSLPLNPFLRNKTRKFSSDASVGSSSLSSRPVSDQAPLAPALRNDTRLFLEHHLWSTLVLRIHPISGIVTLGHLARWLARFLHHKVGHHFLLVTDKSFVGRHSQTMLCFLITRHRCSFSLFSLPFAQISFKLL